MLFYTSLHGTTKPLLFQWYSLSGEWMCRLHFSQLWGKFPYAKILLSSELSLMAWLESFTLVFLYAVPGQTRVHSLGSAGVICRPGRESGFLKAESEIRGIITTPSYDSQGMSVPNANKKLYIYQHFTYCLHWAYLPSNYLSGQAYLLLNACNLWAQRLWTCNVSVPIYLLLLNGCSICVVLMLSGFRAPFFLTFSLLKH